jgi:uncharacterized protein
MRLCVVSDTHRHRHELLMAVKCAQPLDAILHAGDETSDVSWLVERVNWPIHAVAGNWDTPTDVFPTEAVVDRYGPRIFLTHGHRHRVKEGLSMLAESARQHNAQIVVFGHTHASMAVMLDGIVFLNPGSLAEPRGRREKTFALLDIEEQEDEGHFDVRVSHMTATGLIINSLLRATL